MIWFAFALILIGILMIVRGTYLEKRIKENGVWKGKYLGDADVVACFGGVFLMGGVVIGGLTLFYHLIRAILTGVI